MMWGKGNYHLVKASYRPGPVAISSLNTFLVYLVQVAIKLALLVLVAMYLGPSEFGKFAALTALAISLGTLSTFGLGYIVLRQTAISPEKGETVLVCTIPATILSTAMLMPLYLWLCRNFLESDTGTLYLLLIGLTEFIFIPLVLACSQRLQGMDLVPRSQALILLPHLFRLVGIVTCFMFFPNESYETYILVYFLASVVVLPIALTMIGFLKPFLRSGFPTVSQILGASPFALMRFTSITPMEIDKTLALRLLHQEDAGIYSLAARGFSMAAVPITAIIMSVQPRLIRSMHSDTASLNWMIVRILAIAGLVGMIAGLAMAAILAPLAQSLMGREFSGIDRTLQLLALAAPFMAIRIAGGGLLVPLNRPLLRSYIELAGLAVLVSMAIILASQYDISGLILAVIISESGMALAFLVYLWRWRRKNRN